MKQEALCIIDAADAFRELLSSKNVVLTTHVNPDGDAIGSELGLYRLLRAHGVSVRIINAHPLPENLRFLDPDDIVEVWNSLQHDYTVLTPQLLVCLDLNEQSRMGAVSNAIGGDTRILVIDHHLEPRSFAHLYYIDPDACSTAELVFRLVTQSAYPLSYEIALPLYVGLLTDTGSFRFERTTPEVHRIAATMLETGVDAMETYRAVYNSYSIGRSRLLGLVLSGIEQYCEGRVTLLTVTAHMLEQTDCTIEDVENIVNYGLGIQGVEVTALFTELNGAIKISLRSRGCISINRIANEFGGGGHRLAAGARVLDTSLNELKPRVAAMLCEVVSRSGEASHTGIST